MEKQCSRCGKERDTEGYPLWCKECRTAYRREYDAIKVEKAEKGAAQRACRATKAWLAEQFARLGSGRFTANEVAQIIIQSNGPDFS